MIRRQEPIRNALFERTRAHIAERIRPICLEMCDEEFEALLDQMATIEIKYAQRRTEQLFAPILQRVERS